MIMNKKQIFLVILLFMFSINVHAEEMTLQEQVDAIKEQIRQEEITRNQLHEDLSAMDKKVENLKQQLQELEAKISSSQK